MKTIDYYTKRAPFIPQEGEPDPLEYCMYCGGRFAASTLERYDHKNGQVTMRVCPTCEPQWLEGTGPKHIPETVCAGCKHTFHTADMISFGDPGQYFCRECRRTGPQARLRESPADAQHERSGTPLHPEARHEEAEPMPSAGSAPAGGNAPSLTAEDIDRGYAEFDAELLDGRHERVVIWGPSWRLRSHFLLKLSASRETEELIRHCLTASIADCDEGAHSRILNRMTPASITHIEALCLCWILGNAQAEKIRAATQAAARAILTLRSSEPRSPASGPDSALATAAPGATPSSSSSATSSPPATSPATS